VANLEGKNMEGLGIYRMIILKWAVRKLDARAYTVLN
jgi:hypothetical protein